MKSGITPFNTLKPKNIETISKYLCSQEEIIYSSKAQLNYPTDLNIPDENCYVILTYGFIYLFVNENKDLKLRQQICTLSCQEINLHKDKEKDDQPSISIVTNADKDTITILNCENIETLYQNLYFSIYIISGGLFSHFSLPNLIPKVPMKFFSVQFSIYKRSLYFIHLEMKQQNIPKSEIEGYDYFNDPNIYFKGQLLINQNFHPGQFSEYYGRAIGYEPRLYAIVLSNFNEEFITFIQSILNSTRFLVQIKFIDYESKNTPPFNFEKVDKTSIEKFQFANSNFSLIENFMNGLINSNINVKKIKLASIQMVQNDILNFFDNLNKIQCFDNIVSFSLTDIDDGHMNEFPMKIFGHFLKSHKTIETVTISNIKIEATTVLTEICNRCPNIYEIHLNRLNFDLPLSIEGENAVNLPSGLILADLSHSRFKNSTLLPILDFLTSKDNEGNKMIVNMGYIEPSDNLFIKTYKGINQKTNLHSNICEVNWSSNHISPDLFKFFTSQTHLKFLTIMDLNIQKQAPFFQLLSMYVIKAGITGLEIGSDSFDPQFVAPFIASLKNLKNLEYFRFHCQPGQEKLGIFIADLIASLPNLKELAVEMKLLTPDAFLKIAKAVAANESIVACSLPKCDVNQENPNFAEISALMKKILKLKTPSTIEQRTSVLIGNKKKDMLNVENIDDHDNFEGEEKEKV